MNKFYIYKTAREILNDPTSVSGLYELPAGWLGAFNQSPGPKLMRGSLYPPGFKVQGVGRLRRTQKKSHMAVEGLLFWRLIYLSPLTI